jgi:hypothetical protein
MVMLRRGMMALLVAATVLPLLADASAAQERRREERRFEERRAEERFRDRDIRRFRERDFDVWRRGGWIHGRHDGRLGWWWVVNGTWYFYPQPVYPYPDPYVPPAVVAAPVPAPGGQLWYFCRNPRGYYPYVARCLVPWQAVPPT